MSRRRKRSLVLIGIVALIALIIGIEIYLVYGYY